MIVTSTAAGTHTAGAGPQTLVRCLARRGMLHSECEAYDYVRLAPTARFEGGRRAGAEQAWYVIEGSLALDGDGDDLVRGSLLLAPQGCEQRAMAGPAGARLLALSVLPAMLAARLPHRGPEMPCAVASRLEGPR